MQQVLEQNADRLLVLEEVEVMCERLRCAINPLLVELPDKSKVDGKSTAAFRQRVVTLQSEAWELLAKLSPRVIETKKGKRHAPEGRQCTCADWGMTRHTSDCPASEDMFPVLHYASYDGVPKSIPKRLFAKHLKQVKLNHSQSLDTLECRGGLTPDEILPILAYMDYQSYWRRIRTRDAIRSTASRLLIELLKKEGNV